MQHPKKPLVRTPTAVDEIMDALSAPFERAEVKCRPGVVSGNRALALHFVDARVIQDRLDDVLGVTGWQDEYEVLADGSVVCKLRLRLGGEWITKMDVGSPSEQPDEGDRRKAAFSDALKRAAVKFGVGRYLYRVPQQWCDYDPAKRRFVRDPSIPDASLPKPKAVREASPSTVVKPVAAPADEAKRLAGLPKNGAELQGRLYAHDAALAKQGRFQPGELVKHVVQAGIKAGFDADLATWNGPAILLAVEQTRAFEARDRKEVA